MKKSKMGAFAILSTFLLVMLAAVSASATTSSSNSTNSKVSSITLSGENANISWSVDGYSSMGFKVVWSKNSEPTYPCRSGDKYNYLSSSSATSDTLTAFDGSGTYYVRVCEYLGGKCGVYSNQIAVSLESTEKVACTLEYNPICGKNGKTYSNKCVATAAGVSFAYFGECKKDEEIKNIEEKAEKLANNQLSEILAELKELRNLVKEQQAELKYLRKLVNEMNKLSEAMQSAINNFVTYGADENTKKLGAGERAAVINSYKEAYGKLPGDNNELADVIKIANGRWPSKISEEALTTAKENFIKVYEREPDMNNANDSAAVTIMAYGLRQKAENRNLRSEQKGIEIFNDIFGQVPQTTEEWNIMQAITYSGAKR